MSPVRELKKVVGDVYYIPGRTNVGVIVRDDWCIVVDTGLDEDQGRRVINVIGDYGLKIKYIFNTHSHADHIGGNRIISNRANATILAPYVEAHFIENPMLEPAFIYGSHPPGGLRGKFFMAEPSPVGKVISEGVDEDLSLRYVSLPGHSLNMHGIIVDNVFFIADALFPESLVKKFRLIYHFNVKEAVKTLENLAQTSYRFYVPSHFEPASDISKIVDINLEAIDRVRKLIEEHTSSGIPLEELFSTILLEFELDLSPQMFFLYSSALKSYISWLIDEEDLEMVFKEGKLYVCRVE